MKGAVLTAALLVLVEGFFLERDLRETDAQVRKELQLEGAATRDVLKGAVSVETKAGTVLDTANSAAKEVAGAAREQRSYWKALSKESVAAVHKANDLLVTADTLLKDVDKNQNALSDETRRTLLALQGSLKESQETLHTLTATIRDADSTVADPKLKELADHMDHVSANMEKMSDDIEKAVHRATKAPNMVVAGVKTAFDLAWKLKSLIF